MFQKFNEERISKKDNTLSRKIVAGVKTSPTTFYFCLF